MSVAVSAPALRQDPAVPRSARRGITIGDIAAFVVGFAIGLSWISDYTWRPRLARTPSFGGVEYYALSDSPWAAYTWAAAVGAALAAILGAIRDEDRLRPAEWLVFLMALGAFVWEAQPPGKSLEFRSVGESLVDLQGTPARFHILVNRPATETGRILVESVPGLAVGACLALLALALRGRVRPLLLHLLLALAVARVLWTPAHSLEARLVLDRILIPWRPRFGVVPTVLPLESRWWFDARWEILRAVGGTPRGLSYAVVTLIIIRDFARAGWKGRRWTEWAGMALGSGLFLTFLFDELAIRPEPDVVTGAVVLALWLLVLMVGPLLVLWEVDLVTRRGIRSSELLSLPGHEDR